MPMAIPLVAAGIGAAASRSASRRAADAAKGANASAEEQARIAREQWDVYKENYLPLEKELVEDARNYDTAERRDQAANSAMADQQREFDAAQAQMTGRLASMGLNPADGRFQSGMQSMAVTAAANKAGAGTLARRAVETEGYARRATAVGLGKGIPGQAQSGLAAAQQGLANSARMQSQNAANTAGGVAYLVNQAGNALFRPGTQAPAPVYDYGMPYGGSGSGVTDPPTNYWGY